MADDRDKRAEKIVNWAEKQGAQTSPNLSVTTANPKLTPEAKQYVIARLIEGFPCRIIAGDVQRLFDIEITTRSIAAIGKSKKTKALIDAARMDLVKHMATIPIARKEVRLAYLHHLYELALNGRKMIVVDRDGVEHEALVIDPALALKAIKTAQEEIGEKEKWLADAIEKAAMAKRPDVNVVIVDYGALPANESDRLVREWGHVFGKG